MHDLVIKGGTVVDGTGLGPRAADVAIADGRIVGVGADVGAARRTLDADGLLVTPGWVDIHSHYDGQALWDPVLETSAAHGVTTVVMGNCGVGFAPVQPAHRAWTITLMEGVEDIPAAVLEQGLDWGWTTFPEYLDALERAPHAIDVAAQIPHAALRVFAMGERGIDHAEVPTEDEVATMARLAAEAIAAGAVGFSSSRSRNHVASDGRITPSFSAGDAELLGIVEAIGRLGKGVVEINVDTADLDGDMQLLRRLCEAGRRPVSMGLLQRPGQGDNYRKVLQAFEQAAAAGFTMLGQAAPRPTGLLQSMRGRVNPLAPSATYRQVVADDRSALRRREVKTQILEELSGEADITARFPLAFELGTPPRYDRPRSESLVARATAAGVDVKDLVYDIVAGGGFVYVPVSNYSDGDLRAVHEMLVHPCTLPGLSDGGAHCTMIADFDYPTFLLSYWGRDAPDDLRMPVEWVVEQQCVATAELVGLHDRGTLQPGKRADVNLIDFDAVGSTPPAIVSDLPSGGSRLVSHGIGYVATVVAGEVTFDNGAYTARGPVVSLGSDLVHDGTLVGKIWGEHVVADLGDDWALLHVDRHLVHDVTSPGAFTTLAERGLRVRSPHLTFGATEHSVSVLAGRRDDSNPLSARFAPQMRSNCADHGVRLFDVDDPDQGIVHVIGPELGLTLPGTTVVCGDSHTCTNGGLGALGFGIGTSELAHVLATQTLLQRRLASMRITFTGALGRRVEPKDLILHTIAALGADAGVGHAIEFAGALVSGLGVEPRMTICNLAVELGAKVGIVGPDDITFDYVAGRRYAPRGRALDDAVAHWRTLVTDAGARFDREVTVDGGAVAPQVTWGVSPAHSVAVDERVPDLSDAPDDETAHQWAEAMRYIGVEAGQRIEGLPVDWVFVGSCTNGRLSDLEAAAEVVAGRRVASHVRALVVPGSRSVARAAVAAGLDRVFVDAGFEWGEPGCGLCPGLGGVHLERGDRCISTSNRNFVGRQGQGVRTHLAGAATAALAAIEGVVADVRTV